MSYIARYVKGDWKTICDSCGRLFKASMLKQRWDGLMVCQEDWEPRQPQDFVRGVADIQTVAWVRDETQDTFILGCSTRTARAGYASAGCAISGLNLAVDAVPQGTF